MATELILLENVDNLGLVGESISVADGYARNFLLPRKLALPATQVNMRQLEVRKEKALQQYKEKRAVAENLAKELNDLGVVTVMANASDEQKLFGSITNVEISSALTESGYEINRRDILLKEPIKTLGLFEFKVKLHQDVSIDLKVMVSKA